MSLGEDKSPGPARDTQACSSCFTDRGLRLEAERLGIEDHSACPNCGSQGGRKLDLPGLEQLAHSFFVRGTFQRFEYGAAPAVVFNRSQTTSIGVAPWLESDVRLLERRLGVGFFHYGPRFWMFGEVEPLKALLEPSSRAAILERILKEYPGFKLTPEYLFYRLRLNPGTPHYPDQYDSPPPGVTGRGRLDAHRFPVLYGSPDLQLCIHECRTSVEDEVFVATLAPTRPIEVLDLTAILQEDVTEFESLDLAVQMLFLAGDHSYAVSRAIAQATKEAGFGGLLYPSYFSLLRTGGSPFETTYGISHRRIRQLADSERAKIVPNIALFGRPIEDGVVEVRCINRVVIRRADYDLSFGPAAIE